VRGTHPTLVRKPNPLRLVIHRLAWQASAIAAGSPEVARLMVYRALHFVVLLSVLADSESAALNSFRLRSLLWGPLINREHFRIVGYLIGTYPASTAGLVPRSLSAVSEVPISRQVVESRCSGGALQIQRLERSRPSRKPMGFVYG
jgi:hypothetical protein